MPAKDWMDDLSEEQLVAIIRAEKELDDGKGVPHDEVLKQLIK